MRLSSLGNQKEISDVEDLPRSPSRGKAGKVSVWENQVVNQRFSQLIHYEVSKVFPRKFSGMGNWR